MTAGRDRGFWRNVVLIALAHIALIAVLIRWSVSARASPNPESIVWLGAAEDLAAESENASAKPERHLVESSPMKDDNDQAEKSVVTAAKSEIELPSPTPKPTPTPTETPHLKPTPSPTPKAKATPKALPKPTAKKIVVAKASAKASPKPKPSSEKIIDKSEKPEKKTPVKVTSETQSGGAKTSSTSKAGTAGGGSSASEFGWYGNMLHDRFYSAWIQPTSNIPSGSKFSALVKVRIDKDGHVSKFEIVKPSDNAVVNESVAAVAKQVSEVDAPPDGLIKGDHYDVKINFELNTEQGTSN